jgi:hypothetical protein
MSSHSIAFHWDVQIEIGKVYAIEQCAGSRDSGVEKEFCCGEIGSGRVLVSRVVNAIATHGEPSPVWFVLLRTIIANNTVICLRASFRDIRFLDEETGVGALLLMNTLE